MKYFIYFLILFYFFDSIKATQLLSCDGCLTVLINSVNKIYFTFDVEPQLVKVLIKGSFENPLQYIYLNITKIDNNKYECNDNFNKYDELIINKEYLIVFGYQNQDYNSLTYLKFHNYVASDITPKKIINSISYYFNIYSDKVYLNDNFNIDIKLIREDNQKSYTINNCNYNSNLNCMECLLSIDKIGTYYLNIDNIEYKNLSLEVLDTSFAVTKVEPNYMININQNNFYLTLNVDSQLYSPLGHTFEFIIADNSNEQRKIVLSGCVSYNENTLYCNKISEFFKELSVYNFFYNEIKLDNLNIFTSELKYPDFKGVSSYDDYYIIEGQKNTKKLLIDVDDSSLIDYSQFYIIDKSNNINNLKNCYNYQSKQILCECEIYYSGKYSILYIDYTISISINFITNGSDDSSSGGSGGSSVSSCGSNPIIINNICLLNISSNSIQLTSSSINQSIYFYLYFNKDISYSEISYYFNNISICNQYFYNCKEISNCSNKDNGAYYCNLYVNSSYYGYNYIYINGINTTKYIYLKEQNNNYDIEDNSSSSSNSGDDVSAGLILGIVFGTIAFAGSIITICLICKKG